MGWGGESERDTSEVVTLVDLIHLLFTEFSPSVGWSVKWPVSYELAIQRRA